MSEVLTLVKILQHQKKVSVVLRQISRNLEQRADVHDLSKLNLDEFIGFSELDAYRSHKKEEYGSKEYEDSIKKNDAVRLHLSRNSHHPEFHPNGIKDMSTLDIIEMLCDWEVARLDRDTETDINKTWETRKKRFNLDDQEITFLRKLWEGLL